MINPSGWLETLFRTLAAVGLLLGVGLAAAEAPASGQAAATPLTDEEARIAYAEVQAIGGMVYTYYLTGSPDEAKLDAFIKQIGPALSEAYADKLGLKKFTAYAFTTSPLVRDVIRTTPVGHLSRKFPYQTGWAVAYVVAAKFMPVPASEQMKDLLPKLVQAGIIPTPADALHPPLNYLYAAAQVHSVDALERLAPEADINMLLPNGTTMLSNSVAAGQADLVTALLNRHADPNKCGAGTCPLTMAVYAKDAPALLDLLLAHGADPNIMDASIGALSPPLTMAVLQPNGVALGELLLSKGANVDGLPGDLPPLVGAAEKGDRAAIEMLLHHGADLFRPAKLVLPPANALTVARRAKVDAKFQAWLDAQWKEVAQRSGRFQWRAAIEQDGKETPVGDKPIVLTRRPFNIVVHMRPDARLMVTASTERSVFDDYKDATREGGAAMHSLAAVVADVCGGERRPLFLSGHSDDPKLNGNRVMGWADAARCQAFTATIPEATGKRYVRTIGTLTTYDGDQDVSTSTIGSLFFVMGTALDTVFPQFEYFDAKQFEVRFR